MVKITGSEFSPAGGDNRAVESVGENVATTDIDQLVEAYSYDFEAPQQKELAKQQLKLLEVLLQSMAPQRQFSALSWVLPAEQIALQLERTIFLHRGTARQALSQLYAPYQDMMYACFTTFQEGMVAVLDNPERRRETWQLDVIDLFAKETWALRSFIAPNNPSSTGLGRINQISLFSSRVWEFLDQRAQAEISEKLDTLRKKITEPDRAPDYHTAVRQILGLDQQIAQYVKSGGTLAEQIMEILSPLIRDRWSYFEHMVGAVNGQVSELLQINQQELVKFLRVCKWYGFLRNDNVTLSPDAKQKMEQWANELDKDWMNTGAISQQRVSEFYNLYK